MAGDNGKLVAQGNGKLTRKQRKFLAKYLETGEPTEAAMYAFDCKSRESACTVGYEYLRKPQLQFAFQMLLEKEGVTDKKLAETLREGLEANKTISAFVIVKPNKDGSPNPEVRNIKADSKAVDFIDVPDHNTRHKYLETALKVTGRLKEGREDRLNVHVGDNVVILPELEAVGNVVETTAQTG